MRERLILPDNVINSDLLDFVLHPPRWFWIAAAVLGLIVLAGLTAFGFMMAYGLGLLGYNWLVYWAVLITNFVFWVGISHAGVMISGILRLTQAEWRRPVTRAAEVLTFFALATAATFPLMHTGRPWRVYWIFPYDFNRDIWPAVRSALVWDPSAIGTYLTGTFLFIYVAMLPDLAVLRDRTTGLPHRFYRTLAIGFRGTTRQWRLQETASFLLSALMLCVFVSVHSIVSWDFATALVANWHSTIFAPYFVIGAVHSGVAAVATIMVILRWAFGYQRYITSDHLDALARLLIVVGTAWLYFYICDFLFGVWGGEPEEVRPWELRVFTWPYSLLFAIFLFTAYLIPVPLWLFRRVRRSPMGMFVTTLLVNVGMWLERYLIVIPSLEHKSAFTFTWSYSYSPTIVEYILTLFGFGLVGFGFLIFSKVFPIIPIFDVKEARTMVTEVIVGEAHVPAVLREAGEEVPHG
ncbi:MAG: polysulfide reductase NrfD [Chloroflexi bacterium]|nr:polysulfide reductase NrfD [Chloroflexota bacterium]